MCEPRSLPALDHVEVVRISAQDFNTMTELFPDVRPKNSNVANEARMQMNRTRLSVISSTPLESFLGTGFDGSAELAAAGLEQLHAM